MPAGSAGASQELQSAGMARHEAFQQGTVHAMEIPDGVGNRERRLQIQVKDGMAQRGQIDQGDIAVS